MVRRAAAIVGSDEDAQRAFIFANLDQGDEFWHPEEPTGVGAAGPAAAAADVAPPPLARARSQTASVDAAAAAAAAKPLPAATPAAGEDWSKELRLQPAFGALQAALQQMDAAAGAGAEAAGAWVQELSPGDLVDVDAAACATSFAGHDLRTIPGTLVRSRPAGLAS